VHEPYSLYELNQLIKTAIDTSFPETVLVTAEIASCDVRNHCYVTLIEKEEDTIIAEIKAVIWARRFRSIAAGFTDATGIELSRGIKILFEASLHFHERYGLKLHILNIDPSYTIGELAVKRREVLERLTKEGLRDRNKALEFPLVPQRIGIISSPSAAGYEDLMSHLTNNPYDYLFTCRLYEALMQGDRAEESVVSALRHCLKDAPLLDVVVIVRGGGGKPDLHCFDSYEIGKAIALLPVPVLSGIGHERDITVVDEISNIRVKTPTAAADLLITRIKDFEDIADSLAHRLLLGTNKLTSDLKETLITLVKRFEGLVKNELIGNFHRIEVFKKGLRYSLKFLKNERERLRSREYNISHLNPKNVLRRGYSITYHNGKAVKSAVEVKRGDSIETILYKGELSCTIEDKRRTGGRHG
jgi:exodeoxyribonuclease VII large subunit